MTYNVSDGSSMTVPKFRDELPYDVAITMLFPFLVVHHVHRVTHDNKYASGIKRWKFTSSSVI
jgi:hypothetical protein